MRKRVTSNERASKVRFFFFLLLSALPPLCAVPDAAANQVQRVVDFVKSTEGIRKGLVWPLISLSMLVILVFITIAFGTCECAMWNISDCNCISRCISPCAVILAGMLWLLVVATAAFSGENRGLCPRVLSYFVQRLAGYCPLYL